MKQFYFSILFFSFSFFVSAQTVSTEVGETEGQLTVSLTGSTNYSIPIMVPPGMNGFEPSISINYNSQRGFSGTASTGWDIAGVSSITRIPATLFHDGNIDPVDLDSSDRFALDGQRLIVKNGTSVYGADGTVYETEYFSNIKITSYGVHPSGANYGPAYFKVEYPNGTKSYYGNSTDSRSVTDWSITNTDNAQGVRINYSYTTANNSLYIASIKYGGLTPTTPINEIKFVYSTRNYIEESYVGGVNIKRNKNLTNINVIGNGFGFRNYVLGYNNQERISSVTEKSGDNTKSYNPTNFDYNYGPTHPITYVNGNNTLDVGQIRSDNAATVSGDFDADGNMDFLLYPTTESSVKAKYWLYTDTNPNTPFSMSIPHNVGAFDEIFPVTYIDSGNKIVPAQGWTVIKGGSFTTFYLNSTYGTISQNDQKMYAFPRFILDYQYQCNGGGGELARTQVVAQPMGPITPPDAPINVHYESNIPIRYISGDFNGDGITDVVAIEKSFGYPYRYMCTSYTSTYPGGRVFFINLDKRITTGFATVAGNLDTTNASDIRVADFNGDGKSDIYVFDTGKVKVYGLNNSLSFVLLYQSSETDVNIMLDRPILMGDYNGDGKTDFMIPKAFNEFKWFKYTSTGNSLLKEEMNSFVLFIPNDSYNTYNYIPIDFNNDNKTDVICSRSFRNVADTQGSITVDCFANNNGSFPAVGNTYHSTAYQSDINIYALPVYLPMSQGNSKFGFWSASSTIQVAFLNQNKIHFFSCDNDYTKDNLLTNITTGNGVKETVTYIPMNSAFRNTYNTIYTPSTSTANYPNFDIKINPNLFIVSKIEQESIDVKRKRLFGYYGAVSNVEGLGFLGFRSVTQTNWHDDTSKIFTSIYKNDIDLRGANLEIATVPYLYYPYAGVLPSDFTTKSITTYNNALENPLQSNKVFKLKTTNVKQFNSLNNINTEVKSIVYDNDNNITSSTTISSEASTPIKTVKTDITYETVKTTPLYILGRPGTKIQSVTGDGHTMTTNEKYVYNAQELLLYTEKNAIGTTTIKESYAYDSYGNVTQKTITPALPMLPRTTKYEYDLTKRFISKITDNDNLVTSFEYDSNGLLKKETNPYTLSKSYTYDSWFKNLTIKDDQLNNTITNTYTRNAEKTIVTTTASAPGLDISVSEDTFDGLGRKIKSGVKDLNGNFSYVSYLYDIYDRNFKVSEPYTGTSASQWNEVKFDDYGRNKESSLFNGRTTSVSYTPSSLKATLTDGVKSKTTIQNAAGNTISTNETIGGDILYSSFANGNLRKTSYNGIDIVFEQDGWGNTTVSKDPSAGTYRYNYNGLGELLTETVDNAGITTTIVRDGSGKPTKKTIVSPVTNTETNFTYDGDLPLTINYTDYNEPAASRTILTSIKYDTSKRVESITEDKTGVSKFTTTYTYDNLDRITTETKLAEIGTKSSRVKTRNFYKNGNLYQILDDATSKVLWQRNTLNAKGQTVESETGNGIKMTNIYDPNTGYLSTIKYDKITSPTSNILTLTTNFDKNTDYLNSRVNSAFGNYTESFTYDDIGRLKEFTNRLGVKEIQTYDASGKITTNSLGSYEYDPIKKYQNTSITLTPEATGYYANREGIFSDSMEDKTGWGTEKYPNTNFFSYDVAKAPHAYGKATLKLANTTTSEQFVNADKWISIDNTVPTEYTYSAWVYSDNPQSQIYLYMKDAANTVTHTNTVNNTKGVWTQIIGAFSVPANIKKLRIRLDNNGLGNIWYDDIEIRKTSDPTSAIRQLNTTYNAFKSPIQIEETNVDKISFSYNDDNQRSAMYYGGFQTDKFVRPLRKYYSADGTMEVKENTISGAIEFITYVGADGYSAPIAAKSDGVNPVNYLYLHRDYQGTILAVTDVNGAIIEKRLFDAWGSIIKVQDGAGNALNGLTVLDRGYTGHEHLQSVGLINMNARLYDPILHRFLQVDNFIQDPTNTQNYNQYGYVVNNPLLYTDPSGNICEGCSGGPGVNNGSGTGTSTDLHELGRDTGITDWTRKNLNFNSWGRSWNRFWGKNGGDDNPKPKPNVSKYGNIQMPSQHSSFGFNWTYLSEGKPGERFIYDFFNGFYTSSQIFIGRGVGDYSMRNLDSSATTTDEAVWGLVGAVSNGTAIYELKGALSNIKAIKAGSTTVLGHYPDYVNLAERIGARRFQIPTNVWNKMSPAEQWAANVKFLDRMIVRGDNIRLATPLNHVKPGSFFERELKYLFIDNGYKISSDGLWIVK